MHSIKRERADRILTDLERSTNMIRESIIKLSQKQDLTYGEAEEVMDEIMSGKATPGTDVRLSHSPCAKRRNY